MSAGTHLGLNDVVLHEDILLVWNLAEVVQRDVVQVKYVELPAIKYTKVRKIHTNIMKESEKLKQYDVKFSS